MIETDSGTLLDLIPPDTMVGVTVIRDNARRTEANLGLTDSMSEIIFVMLSGDGLCSMAKVDRWLNSSEEVSNSG